MKKGKIKVNPSNPLQFFTKAIMVNRTTGKLFNASVTFKDGVHVVEYEYQNEGDVISFLRFETE